MFPGRGGGRLNKVDKAWHTVLKEAKITEFRFHDLRHTYASDLVDEGADLYVVCALLGQSSIHMTQRYAHLRNGKLQDAVNLLDDKGTKGAATCLNLNSQK